MVNTKDTDSNRVTQDQVEGCLLGVLVGDSLGFPFENEFEHQYSNPKIVQFFEGLHLKKATANNVMQYTDDTSMTKSVAQHLMSNRGEDGRPAIDPHLLSSLFTKVRASEKWDRHYPEEILDILTDLENEECATPYGPAGRVREGQGSPSNSGASRVSPIVLTTTLGSNPDLTNLVQLTVDSTRITHSHSNAIVGAIFHALAIHQALEYGKNRDSIDNQFSVSEFLDDFTKKFDTLREGKDFKKYFEQKLITLEALDLYKEKLEEMRKLIKGGIGQNLDAKVVKSILGVKTEALNSVPTALFTFLAAFQPIPFIQTDNQFHRTIQLAICLGGMNLASMAGSIAGAYLSSEVIPLDLLKHCEDWNSMKDMAGKLYRSFI